MRIGSIVIRCYEFERMLTFWQAALRYVSREPAKDGWVVLRDPEGRGPNLSLDRAPERRSGKRSWLHLTSIRTTQKTKSTDSSDSGDSLPWRYRPDADFVVLEDPDGNLFCVVQE